MSNRTLSLFLSLMMAVSVLAADVITSDIPASPKVGDSFTVKNGTDYTITYTITKAVSGTASDASFTQGEVELTKFEFGSSTNQTKYEQLYEAGYLYVYYSSPSISQNLKRGGYCVTSIGTQAFTELKSLKAITLDYAEKDIPGLKIGEEAFRNDTKFYALYAKNNQTAMTFPEFSSVGKFAFSNSGLTMTVKVNGDIEESAFNNCKIAQFYMRGHHKLSKDALANCGKLNYVEVGGNDIDPEAIYNTAYELIVSWTGGSSNVSDVKKSPFYGARNEIVTVTYSGDIPNHYFEEFPNLKELWSRKDLVYPNGQYKNPKIGFRAFMNCKKLKLIQVGGAIGDDAFYGCSAINSIVWRGGDPYEGRTDLSGALYYDAPFIDISGQITSFKFESTPVTTPAKGLCAYMVNLKEVTIPFMGNTLGDNLFAGCTKLETVTFDWGEYDTDKYSYNFELSRGIFSECTALKEVKNLPKCLTVVHSSAFYGCTSLHQNPVTLNHKKLTTIESYAFHNSAIDTLYIPENVTKIGGGTYSTAAIADGTTNLKAIVYLPGSLTRKQVSGAYSNIFFTNIGGSGGDYEQVETVYINQVGLTAIPDSMFMGWTSLKAVYPMNATTLQPNEYASFPNLTTIGKAAFMRTTSLETCRPLAAGTKITKIDDYAFYKSAVSVDIYDFPKLTEIGKYAFAESGITSFAAGYQGKANANTDYKTCNLEKLTTIGENAFKDCSKLTKVGFPYSLKTIGKDAFSGCPVTSIIWAPANYTSSDPLTKAGIDKTKITSADIATATIVPDEFLRGAAVKTLDISSNVEKLGKLAFAETSSLDSVYINTPLSKQESTKDAEGPFYHSAVKKAQFGKMATKVAENLFGYALDLNWVNMPKVTAIGSRAFRDTKLKDVVLRDVTEIGEGAFYNFQTSYKYDSFTIYGNYVTDEDAVRMAFSKPGDSPRSSWAVYKVYGSCNVYTELLQNQGWKDMASSISQLDDAKYTLAPDKAGIKQGEGTVEVDDSHYCEGYITLKATPKEGYEFMYWYPQLAVKYDDEVDPTNPEITIQLDKYNFTVIFAVFAKPDDFIDLTLNVQPADVGHIDIYNEIGLQLSEPKFLKDERAILVPVSDNDWYQPASSCNFYENWIVDNENNFTSNRFNGVPCAEVTFNYQPMMGDNPEEEYELPDYPTQVTAKFTYRRVPVDIYTASNGGGTFEVLSDDSDCHDFDENDPWMMDGRPRLGDKILIVAQPNKGYKFSYWGEDKSNTKDTLHYTISMDNLYKEDLMTDPDNPDNVRIKVMDANGNLDVFEQSVLYFVEVMGWFEVDETVPVEKTKYTITAVSSDDERGTVAGSGTYEAETWVELRATAKAGYEFSMWTDGELANPRIVVVSEDATYEAMFITADDSKQKYDITVKSEDDKQGTVTGNGTYTEGSMVTISAQPIDGYEFDEWSDGSKENPRIVTVTEALTLTAKFKQATVKYTITVESSDPTKGLVSGSGKYSAGEKVTIKATPLDGYHFVRWDDDNTQNPRTITVTADDTYIAYFEVGTALNETQADESAVRKVLIDGQIFIINNGVMYNVLGAKVE